MFKLSTKIIRTLPSADKLYKNVQFGTAMGLTKTAKDGQAAVQGAVKGSFVYRNNWLPQSNRFGIKVKSATAKDLTATVHTRAGWLVKQKVGKSIKAGDDNRRIFPYTYDGKEYIARPSKALRPKGSTKVLIKRLWPENIKNGYVIRTRKSGQMLLMTRFAPGKQGAEVMYILDEVINVKPKDAFYAPIQKVVDRRRAKYIKEGIAQAFSTMR